jgi:hypothetical protein
VKKQNKPALNKSSSKETKPAKAAFGKSSRKRDSTDCEVIVRMQDLCTDYSAESILPPAGAYGHTDLVFRELRDLKPVMPLAVWQLPLPTLTSSTLTYSYDLAESEY